MRIYITITDEPIFLTPFIKEIVRSIPSEIIGIAIVKGSLFKAKNRNRLSYLFTLLLISNPIQLFKKIIIMVIFNIFNKIKVLQDLNPLSICKFAQNNNIPVKRIDNINSPEFHEYLRNMKPDILINQAQAILKEELLSIPKIGSLNRHGALLPKYRGRLAPFWAYVNKEKETGVSIHFIETKLDSGPIIVQKKIKIERFDSLDSLLKKIFQIAPKAMLEALDILRTDNYKNKLLENNDEQATYCNSPALKDAIQYIKLRLIKTLHG